MSYSEFINTAIANTLSSEKQGPTYFVRPAGSFVAGQTRDKTDTNGGREIAEWLTKLPGTWVEVTSEVERSGERFGKVRYFQKKVAGLPIEAYEGVLLWGELTPEQRATVRVQTAHHAANAEELVTDQIPLKRATRITIMIGDKENPQEVPGVDEQIVYTWYPGRITPFRKSENLQQQLEDGSLDYYATVKSLA